MAISSHLVLWLISGLDHLNLASPVDPVLVGSIQHKFLGFSMQIFYSEGGGGAGVGVGGHCSHTTTPNLEDRGTSLCLPTCPKLVQHGWSYQQVDCHQHTLWPIFLVQHKYAFRKVEVLLREKWVYHRDLVVDIWVVNVYHASRWWQKW
jgi:hypothetical protein